MKFWILEGPLEEDDTNDLWRLNLGDDDEFFGEGNRWLFGESFFGDSGEFLLGATGIWKSSKDLDQF